MITLSVVSIVCFSVVLIIVGMVVAALLRKPDPQKVAARRRYFAAREKALADVREREQKRQEWVDKMADRWDKEIADL